MRVFWEHGYHATSVQDLMKAAGVQKQSLYCAFGDKRSLFLKCLNLYSKQTLFEIQRMLNETDSAVEGVERVMRFASQAPESKNCPPGCLMANTALELASTIPASLRKYERCSEASRKCSPRP